MVSISSGATPCARRFSGSLPSVGPIVWPAPASISARLPPRSSRKAFTEIGNGSVVLSPASRSFSSGSMPSTTSSEVVSTPSLSAVTWMSPIFLVNACMLCSFDWLGLLIAPSPTLPRPAAGLPASGKFEVTKPRQAGVWFGRGSAPSSRHRQRSIVTGPVESGSAP